MPIITITGDLASGKSLVAKKIAAETGADYFSTGNIQREIAVKHGMTTLELNKYSETHPEIDQEIDDRVRALEDQDKDLVVDSRMAWHFLPRSFKVYLATNIVRAAERVIADTERSSEPVYADRNDAMLKLQERKRSENKRYLQLYGADSSRLTNFDIVVDTTYSRPEDTLRIISNAFEIWKRKGVTARYWYSPKSILPVRSLGEFSGASASGERQPVEALLCRGNLYAYAGYEQLLEALGAGNAYIPVAIIASDEEEVPGGSTAQEYVDKNFSTSRLPEWEGRFGFEYLSLSGRFSERTG